MNKLYFSLMLFLGAILSTSAQNWVQQHPNVRLSRLYDLSMNSNGQGWSVGEAGTIFHSSDFGQNWSEQSNSSLSNLFFVAEAPDANGQKVMACGTKISVTEDGGTTWNEYASGFPTGAYNGLAVPSSQAAYIIANTGNVFKSTDFGQTWSDLPLPTTPEWIGISFINDTVGWISSRAGELLKTTDGGSSWMTLDTLAFNIGSKVVFHDENIGYMVVNRDIYRSDDGGLNWTLQVANSPISFQSNVKLAGPNHLLGARFTSIHESIDAGQTWAQYNPLPPSVPLYGIASQPNGQYWISGGFSIIIHSSDSATSWNDQIEGRKNHLDCIRFWDPLVGLAGGDQNTLLKTLDGGQSWQDISLPENSSVNEYVTEVLPLSQDEFWATTNLRVMHSTDGGQNWADIPVNATDYTSLQRSPNGNLLLTSAENGVDAFWRSSDAGQTWTSSDISNGIGLRDLAIVNDSIIVAAGYDGNVLRSNDGGANWSPQITNTGRDIGKVYFPTPDAGWLLTFGRTDTILQTIDGGASWNKILLPLKSAWREMAWLDSQTAWLIGSLSFSSVILQTTDGGQTWTQVHSANNTYLSINLPSTGQAIVWVAGAGGLIETADYTNTNLGLWERETASIHLFPNPTQGRVALSLDQVFEGRLRLYDTSGRVVLSRPWRTSDQILDITALPNGLYHLQLSDGERVYSQKIYLQNH
ncbi:MAG: YCF48-related protein [Bacteroidia bacterium]